MSTAIRTSTTNKAVVALAVAGGIAFAAMIAYGAGAWKDQAVLTSPSNQATVQSETLDSTVSIEEQTPIPPSNP